MDSDDNPNVASNNQQDIPEPAEEEKQPDIVANPFRFNGPLGMLTVFDTRAGARIPEGFTESIGVFDMRDGEQVLRLQNTMRSLLEFPGASLNYIIVIGRGSEGFAEIYRRAPVNPHPPATI